MVSSFKPSGMRVSMKRESSFLSTADDTTTGWYVTDPIFGTIDIPTVDRIREEKRKVGGGRNVDIVIEKGYSLAETSQEYPLQTGMFMYYALGSCSTVGTALSTPFSDTIASGEGTSVVTMTTHTSMTPDEHIGRLFTDTTNGKKYTITDNDASTLTLDRATEASTNGDSCTITEAPYTHTITEANLLPSFAQHFELENDNDSESIRIDSFGNLVSKYTLNIEAGDEGNPVMQNIDLKVPKIADGADFTPPSERTDDLYTYIHFDADNSYISYGSNDLITNTADLTSCWDYVKSVEITIENDMKVVKTLSSAGYFNSKAEGKRDYSIKFTCNPPSKLLYTLRNTDANTYDVSASFKLTISASRYITLTFDKLYVAGGPIKLTDWEDEKQLELEVELRNNVGGTCQIVDVNSVTSLHGYEIN